MTILHLRSQTNIRRVHTMCTRKHFLRIIRYDSTTFIFPRSPRRYNRPPYVHTTDRTNISSTYFRPTYGVHPDLRSHTGSIMTMGTGAVQSGSAKQKINTMSSTEAELVGVDDVIVKILWTKSFIEEQGYEIEKNILYQDNKSSILLETNGRKSAGTSIFGIFL